MFRLSFCCQCDKNLNVVARLLISPSLKIRVGEINKILPKFNLSLNHPDLLYLPNDSKLGINEARKIKDHFSFTSLHGSIKAVVLEDASTLTVEAQNALLKILEEPPPNSLIILGASSDVKFLPTILSRCEVIILDSAGYDRLDYHTKYSEDISKLLASSIEERFEYIEKLKDREEFLHDMVSFFHQKLLEPATHERGRLLNLKEFLRELLQAEEWANQNVNIRAILEYLMLVIPHQK